jgi:hypothetical protein
MREPQVAPARPQAPRACRRPPALASGRHESGKGLPLSSRSISLQSPSWSRWIWPPVTSDFSDATETHGKVSERVNEENISGSLAR